MLCMETWENMLGTGTISKKSNSHEGELPGPSLSEADISLGTGQLYTNSDTLSLGVHRC